jgi:hypothetical protein
MNSSAHLLTSSVPHFAPAAHLEIQLKSDPEFASWFQNDYRPLFGAWQY